MSGNQSSDNNSDLDLDIAELARRPCRQPNDNPSTLSQVTLNDDSDSGETPDNSAADNEGRYGLRRRRVPINYKGMSQDSDDDCIAIGENTSSISKRARKHKPRDVLYVSSLLKKNPTSIKQLEKYIKDPERIESLSKWTIDIREIQINDFDDVEFFEVLQKFVKKCGRFLDQLILICDPACIKPPPYWPKLLDFLSLILKNANLLKKFSMKYHKEGRENKEQIIQVMQVIKNSGQKSLNSLQLLPLVCGTSSSVITEAELNLIGEMGEENGGGISWAEIELGDGLLVDDQNFGVIKSLEKLLEVSKDTLEVLVVQGGLKGPPTILEEKSKQKINFPRIMPKLTELTICPKYSFVSEPVENRNPASKRWREIRLDDINCRGSSNGEDGEFSPLKLILCLGDFPSLEKVVLGNLIELEEFGYALMRKLKIFRCGSRWDLALRFPKTESKKGPSVLKELQLPDGLKDSSFVQKIGKFFPLLTKVWIFLPSVAVLRTFFKAYENSPNLEELYLKTQFDFETTMESCLLPQLISGGGNTLSASSKSVISTLKEYKYFEDYVRYHNIELPLEDEEDLAELRRSSAGIRALKSLKVLDLEHIPRTLLIPNPNDERRWYDHNFKYLNTTFGFKVYPFSHSCHREIKAMNLREYHWRLFYFPDSAETRTGWVTMDEGEFLSSDDDDLFFPVSRRDSQNANNSSSSRRASSKGVKVAIKPSMLIPDHFNKDKIES